jgi:hypothetical protein
MKLYEVPKNTNIVLEDGTELLFKTIDGMYSVCYTKEGELAHLAAWTEVTIKDTENEVGTTR